MKVTIDHRGVIMENDGRPGATTLALPPTSAPVGLAPNALNVNLPTSASLYTLTTPGFYYLTGALAATASLPSPSSVPGSLWTITLNAGLQTLMLTGTAAQAGLPVFQASDMTGSLATTGTKLTIPSRGSAVLVSAGMVYLLLAASGSVTVEA